MDSPAPGGTAQSSTRSAEDSDKDQPKRVARACSSCNRQKVKCDGSTPCTRCASSGIGASCEYLPSLRGKTRQRKDHSIQDEKRSRMRTDNIDSNHFTQWRKETQLAETGQTNAALWGADTPNRMDRMPSGSSMRSILPRPLSSIPSLRADDSQYQNRFADQLTTLPLPGDAHNPLAVLAEASMTAKAGEQERSKGKEKESAYYVPLEDDLKDEAPHIMSLINVHEAEQLFDVYFKYLHPHLPLLDIEHSSPSAVARRSNFLFNAICCVAARAFNVLLWERLKDFARYEMERLPLDKNIDVVQGHLIYAEWNLIRPKSFEKDMSWLRVGIAIRTAIDINLHRVALLKSAREGLPRWLIRTIIRTWLLSFVIDRTLSAQLGKPASMRGENSVKLYLNLIKEGDGSPEDVSVAAWTEWTQILARAMDVFRGESAEVVTTSIGNQDAFPDLVHVFTKQFRQWQSHSEDSIRACDVDERSEKQMLSRIRIHAQYARLVVHSFGLQRALDSLSSDVSASYAEYQTSAARLIQTFETDIDGQGLTRGCPDFVFTALTYATVSLLRCTQPQNHHHTAEDEAEVVSRRTAIFQVARKSAEMLARSAMTPDHLPASQSVFLARLIDVREAAPISASKNPTAPNKNTAEAINFEAFAASLQSNDSRSLWPPPQYQWTGDTDMGNVNHDAHAPEATDLNSWVASTLSYQVPSAALGLGIGSFNMEPDGMVFNQDEFWRSVMDVGNNGVGA